MIRPNFIGPKAFFLNPGQDLFTAAELALIDGSRDSASANYLPFAYSATVREDYDSRRFCIDNENIAAGVRASFGLFLTPDNEMKNLLFQVAGQIRISTAGDSGVIVPSFFLGRKATDNTVVSTKAGTANALATHILLPGQGSNHRTAGTASNLYTYSIQSEVFALVDTAAFVWCFGAAIENASGSTAALRADISLSFRKYATELDVFRPTR